MASQPSLVSVDWTKIGIWCCGEYLHIDDIAEHATKMHSSQGNGLKEGDSKNKIEEASISVNVDKNNKNGNIVDSNNKCENSTVKNDGLKAKKTYYCESCEYTSTQNYHLRIHIENKHLKIRHQCEVCEFRSTTKSGLNRHMKVHLKKEEKKELSVTDVLQETSTEIPNLIQNGLVNEAEIKREIVDLMPQENITESSSLLQNEEVDVANIKQEIKSETPTSLENEMVSVAVSVLTEVKEEVDEKNLQVPSWRIFPEFEHPPLNERVNILPEDEKEVSRNVFLADQAVIEKLHAKLEKNEKNSKRWDIQWRKRQLELEKLKEAKESPNGKKIKKEEGEEIELLWPNPDYITDIVVHEEKEQEPPSMEIEPDEGQDQSSEEKSPLE